MVYAANLFLVQFLWCGVESYGGSRSKSLDRRSRYSIRPVTFECDCSLTQNAFWGSGTARHLGHAAGSNLAVCLRAGPELLGTVAVKDARRSVTGPLSAASARYLRIGDSGFAFGAVK